MHESEGRKMQVIDVEDAKTSLGDLLDAAIRGQEIILTRDAQPVAKLIPLVQRRPRPQFGGAKGLVHIADDFDAPRCGSQEVMRGLATGRARQSNRRTMSHGSVP